MAARALATPARNWATCDSCRRRSICPSTCPLRTCSPSFTASESRSPEMLELTFTVSCACRCPAAVTVRVIAPFFAAEVVTSTGGGGRGLRPWKVAKPTPATMSPAMIQRDFVIGCRRLILGLGSVEAGSWKWEGSSSARCPPQGGFGLAAVDQRIGARQLGLGQLQLGVAHLELRSDAHLLPGARQAQVLARRLQALDGDQRLLPRHRELRDRLLHVGGDAAPAVHQVVLGEQRSDPRLLDRGLGGESVEDVPGQVDAAGDLAVLVEHGIGEAGEFRIAPREAGPQAQRRPVVPLRSRYALVLGFQGEGEGLEAGPLGERLLHRV